MFPQTKPIVHLAKTQHHQLPVDSKVFINDFVRDYQAILKNHIRRFVSNVDDQDDVLQEALIKIIRAIPQFRGDSEFDTWVYRVTRNCIYDYYHQCQSKKLALTYSIDDILSHTHDSSLFADNASPEMNCCQNELQTLWQVSISQLPFTIRQTYALRKYCGLPYEQIANVLTCPIGTIRSRLAQAKRTLEGVLH